MGLKAPKFPFGSASVATLTAADATQAVEILNSYTIIDGKTNAATAARTINLTIGNNVESGDRILVLSKTESGQTWNTVLGTGFTAPTFAGVSTKTKSCEFVYNTITGTFVPVGLAVQID